MSGSKSYIYLTLFPFLMLAGPVFSGQLSPSTEVKANMTLLIETKNCPQCDLSGADLTRLDLSNANLEGANLSRTKMSLSNLSGANLQNAALREAVFYGADLANADLRGADLTGVSFVGAYIVGAVMDGEMIVTTPYQHDDMSDIKETVYVEDTVNSKTPQETENMTIDSRRDFEETPPAVPEEKVKINAVKSSPPIRPVEEVTLAYKDESLPKQSPAAPAAKVAPAIQTVSIDEEAIIEKGKTEDKELFADETKKQPSTELANVQVRETGAVSVDDDIAQNNQPQKDNDREQGKMEQKTTDSIKESSVATPEGMGELPQQSMARLPEESGKDNVDNGDHGKTGEAGEKSIPDTVAADSGTGDQSVGMVQSMLNMFTSEEPSTEILRNVEQLLDANQCYGCNLVGVDLSDENLDSADLEGADLSNAILKDADLEGANLKGVNLTGADLSGADLSEADMYKANLTDADLTNADLEGTLLDYVNFSGVKGYKKQTMMLMDQE